jgi:hypothetical protein
MSKTKSRFHVTLKDPNSEQRRMVTLSRVPCPKCENDPFARGGFFLNGEDGHRIPECPECGGSGDVPATAESAEAFLLAQEAENVKFRLDDPRTLGRYKDTLPPNALEIVERTCTHVPKDTHTVNGFLRAGKVIRSGDPEVAYSKSHKGWLAFHLQEEPFEVMRVGRDSEKMAVTGGQFGIPLKNLYTGANLWDWDTDTIKSAFSTATYAYNIDTHDFFNDVTNELATAGNYTAGGFTLATAVASYDTTTDQVRLDAADISQASATFSFQIITTYKSTGTASTSPLICFLDAGATVAPSAGTLTVTWDATGIWVHDIT